MFNIKKTMKLDFLLLFKPILTFFRALDFYTVLVDVRKLIKHVFLGFVL
jgi:hypothetical protein